MEAEGYKLTFYILMLFKYFFIITPILVIITTILSMIEFKNKKLRDTFNHKDTINGFTTLITVLILGTIGLSFSIPFAVSYFINEKKTNTETTFNVNFTNDLLTFGLKIKILCKEDPR